MNRMDEVKEICLSVLSKNGVNDEFKNDCAEEITAQIIAKGYVRYDTIGLDPQKCVQLLATILNGFKAEHPFVVIEDNEDTLLDSEDVS